MSNLDYTVEGTANAFGVSEGLAALALSLMLSITAPSDEDAEKAMVLAGGLSEGFPPIAVAFAKCIALEMAEDY